MADRRLAAGFAGLLVVALAGFAVASGGGQSRSGAPVSVTLPRDTQTFAGPAPNLTPTPPLGRSGRSHATPPPLESLRDQAQAQAVYDAEAKPGDFVTPPVVSIEH